MFFTHVTGSSTRLKGLHRVQKTNFNKPLLYHAMFILLQILLVVEITKKLPYKPPRYTIFIIYVVIMAPC